jgi:hypothetical protein
MQSKTRHNITWHIHYKLNLIRTVKQILPIIYRLYTTQILKDAHNCCAMRHSQR